MDRIEQADQIGYIVAGVLMAAVHGLNTVAAPKEKILWGSRDDYPKVTMNGEEYAKVGNGNISHMSGSLEVILNPQGTVVTIIMH
jgi:hypothetical protein